MKKDGVSVVMAAYNAEKYIKDAIESVINQTYENWELILVNDCSKDETGKIIEEYAKKDKRIKPINNPENLGLTKSLNIGIKNAKGEYIARLDADDVSAPNRFEKQIKFLRDHPEVALVGSGAYLINSEGKRIGTFNALSRYWLIKRLMLHLNLFIHSSIMVRKEAIEAVGGYREKFICTQDYDLILRLDEKYKITNVKDHLIGWRINQGSETMQQNTQQRVYADIARELAKERRTRGSDNYKEVDFENKIKEVMKRN